MEGVNKKLKSKTCHVILEEIVHIARSLEKIMEESKRCNKILEHLYTIRRLRKYTLKRLKFIELFGGRIFI